MRRASAPVVALLAAGALTASCTTQWYPGYATNDIARTDVVIRTEPPGASIEFNGVKQPLPSPIRIPVEYTHIETHYDRQGNYGRNMREGMSTPVAILTFPIWGIASLFHYRESLRRHTYGGNVHVIAAYVHGYDEATQEIKLEGEAEYPVTITLQKSR